MSVTALCFTICIKKITLWKENLLDTINMKRGSIAYWLFHLQKYSTEFSQRENYSASVLSRCMVFVISTKKQTPKQMTKSICYWHLSLSLVQHKLDWVNLAYFKNKWNFAHIFFSMLFFVSSSTNGSSLLSSGNRIGKA